MQGAIRWYSDYASHSRTGLGVQRNVRGYKVAVVDSDEVDSIASLDFVANVEV